jgi:hypothetical protein
MIAMTMAATLFNDAAWGIAKNNSLSDTRTLWLLIGLSTVLLFSSLLWLIVDYHYSGRSWWKLVS